MAVTSTPTRSAPGHHGRMIDPVALGSTTAGLNMSKADTRTARKTFDAAWARVARNSSTAIDNSDPLFASLPPSFQLVPLDAFSCASIDRCVGVDIAGQCVCYRDLTDTGIAGTVSVKTDDRSIKYDDFHYPSEEPAERAAAEHSLRS